MNLDPTTTGDDRPRLTVVGVDVKSEEHGLCWWLFLLHFLLLAFQYTGKAVRQATFIDTLGAEQLPFVYLAVALCSYPLLLLHGKLIDRFPQQNVLAATAILVSLSLAGFWYLFRVQPMVASATFYVWISIIGILLVSQFWALSSNLLDARQAKRLFGFIGAGGILGSIAGGQLARWAGAAVGSINLLLVAAGILLLLAGSLRLRRLQAATEPARGYEVPTLEAPASDSVLAARDGFTVVRHSPYLKLIAAIMLLSAMVAQFIDLQFSWAIERATSTLDQRTALFGNLYSVMGVAALAFQLLFTSRIHRRLGVGFALRVLPASNALGSVLFLIAALVAPQLVLPAAFLLKISENGFRYSLDQATRELLYLPVAATSRPKAKAFIDVFVQRFAKGLAAIVLLSVTFGLIDVATTAWFSLLAIAGWLGLLGATHQRYVHTFRDGLLQRTLRRDQGVNLSDAATLELLVGGLGSSDQREVLNCLELLSSNGRNRLINPLLIHHEDPQVRQRALEILAAENRCDYARQVEALLLDPDPTVRAAATRTLAALTPDNIRQMMNDRLTDPDIRVRAAAVSVLAAESDPEIREQAGTTLGQMISHADGATRLEAARALGELPEPEQQAGVVQLLYDPDPAVVRCAVEAVSKRVSGGRTNPLYIPILVSHLHDRRLKHEARAALVAYGEKVVPALELFMNDEQEEIWVRRALPKTIAQIGGPKTIAALVGSLAANDPFQRRKIIEALASLRSRDDGLVIESGPVSAQLERECRSFLTILIDIDGLSRHSDVSQHLLVRLLDDRLDDHRRNLFGLLSLIHSPRDIRAANQGLHSSRRELRAHALEYLDNILESPLRRKIFAVIDELTVSDRLRLAKRLFDLSPTSPESVLEKLARRRPDGDADGAWLTAAALHFIYDHELVGLYPLIREASKDDVDPLVTETTELLLARMGGSTASPAEYAAT